MTKSVAFRCKACGEEATDIYWDGAEIAGFAHCLKWLAPANGPDPENPLLLERPPTIGEQHWAAVRFPFQASSEEPFWCLYMPPLSYFNGWEDFLERSRNLR